MIVLRIWITAVNKVFLDTTSLTHKLTFTWMYFLISLSDITRALSDPWEMACRNINITKIWLIDITVWLYLLLSMLFFNLSVNTFSLLTDVLLETPLRVFQLHHKSITNGLCIHKDFFFDIFWVTDLNEYNSDVCHKF